MTDYVQLAAEGLSSSAVYVDSAASVAQAGSLPAAYSGSGVGIVVLPEVATTTFSPASIASQVLQATGGKYKTVIVVIDKNYDTFGVAGQNADKISAVLNGANTGNAGEALIAKASEVKSATSTVTTTEVPKNPEGSGSLPLVGGVSALLVVGVVAACVASVVRKSKRRSQQQLPGGNNPTKMDSSHVPAELTAFYKEYKENNDALKSLTPAIATAYQPLVHSAVVSGDKILNYLDELFERIDKKAGSQARTLAIVEYKDKLQKLNKAMGDGYFLDIVEHPDLWDNPEERAGKAVKAVTATSQQIIDNIRQVNASQDLEFGVALEALIGAMDAPTVEDAYKKKA